MLAMMMMMVVMEMMVTMMRMVDDDDGDHGDWEAPGKTAGPEMLRNDECGLICPRGGMIFAQGTVHNQCTYSARYSAR